MAGLAALISSVINLVSNSLHEIKNTYFAPSSSSSAQAPDKHVLEADLKRLMRMLERIRVTLYDAEERCIRDKSVKLWLKELRELGHEAERVLDEYMYEVYSAQVEARNNDLKLEKKRKPSDQSCAYYYYVKVPDGMADRIRSITDRFEEIAKDRKALRLREDEAQRRPYNKMQDTPTSPVVVEKGIFGREVEKEEVIDRLLFSVYNQRKSVLVLPIVGKGGLGKTTLAQLVYNDKRLRERFDMFGWVYVSDDFNIERIVRDMIESFTRTGCHIRNPSVLLEELASEINGKRIFLVLDDVWNEKPGLWDSLRNHLMRAKAACILVTTRNVSVARIMQTMDPLHLSYLPDDKCWSLFTYYAFQGIEPAKQSVFVKIGKEIVKKCGGLPLGIKSIASLLNREADEHSWMEILESDLWETDATKEILASLQISYERLPVYLKPCLVLCSMFPKDYEYDMALMTRLWIVNGYIEPKENKNPEEVAVDYVRELHGRSFFDDFNTEPIDGHENWCSNSISEKRSFRLHDMVHDLAWLKSENTCYSVERGISNQICHLYISDEWRLRGSLDFMVSMNIPVLQTLVMQSPLFSFDVKDTKPISFTFLSKAECLRALHLGDAEVQPLPLWHPKHLRYLFCYATQISPQFLFSAYNLRTLILQFGENTTEMDLEGIGNLLNLDLLQLHIDHSDIKLPESFGFLSKLRVLEIVGSLSALPESIGNLEKLKRVMIESAKFKELPESFCLLTNLEEAVFQRCNELRGLPEDFGKLTNLKFMYLESQKLQYLPLSCSKLIPRCTMNVRSLTRPDDSNSVGWLKEFNDLKGNLWVKGICNILSLADAKNANLISKHNLETLLLQWERVSRYSAFLTHSAKMDKLEIIIDHSQHGKSLDVLDPFHILEIFQPHPNLKHLHICNYPGLEFPRWIGDPLSCASLVKLLITGCHHLRFVPLGNMLSLKELDIFDCYRLPHLKRESLPSQLEHLTISWCMSLAEVDLPETLITLSIYCCSHLKSLVTDQQRSELMSFPSLKELYIEDCLRIEANQLLLGEGCDVNIYDCPKLKDLIIKDCADQ